MAELKRVFNTVDYVPPYYVFEVAGNNYLLICIIHFHRQKLYVRAVFTHAEYDRWSKTCASSKS
jgi:mRNA interferase HigB